MTAPKTVKKKSHKKLGSPQNPYPNLRPDEEPGATRLKFASMSSAPGLDNLYSHVSVEAPDDAIGWIATKEREGCRLLAIIPGSFSGHGVFGHIGMTMFFAKAMT